MSTIDILWDLQQLDIELQRYRKVLKDDNKKKELVSKKNIIEKAKVDLDNLKKNAEVLSLSIRNTEKELDFLTLKIKEAERKFYDGSINSSKELKSMETIILQYYGQKKGLEDRIFIKLEEIEKLQKEIEKTEKRLKTDIKEYNISRENYLIDREKQKSYCDSLESKREELLRKLDNETVLIYHRLIGEKNGIALSTLEGVRCTICGISLPTGFAATVKKNGKITFCQSCGRILYKK